MMKFIALTLVFAGAVGMAFAADETPETPEIGTPEVGEQVLQKADLPVNRSDWKEVKDLGKVVPPDSSEVEPLYYWLFLPSSDSAKSENGYPLLLFLHGAGERGSNPEAVKVHGPPKLVETEQGASWPFITVSPQCPDGKYWSPGQLIALIDKIASEQNVDRDRIYVTGLSMGGFATWMILSEIGDRIAAAAPICGGFYPDQVAGLTEIPIWIFHGDSDSVVPVRRSQEMFDALIDAGSEKVKLTLYPGVDHNSWTATYDNPELYRWFLSNSLKDRK